MNEWMREAARELSARAVVTFSTGAQVELDGAQIVNFTVREGADGALTPGSVLSSEYTLTLVNDEGQWREGGSLRGNRPLMQATVQLWIESSGNELPCGVFVVTQAEAQERGGTILLRGSDSIAQELSGTFEDALAYPATLQEVWAHWVAQTRYVWSGTVPNASAVVDARPDWKDASLRRAAGWIAQAAGCFVRLSRTGALELVSCRSTQAESLTMDDCLSMTDGMDVYGPIAALEVLPDGAEAAIVVSDGAGETISIRENPLYQADAAHLNDLIAGTLKQLKGLTLRRMDFVWRGDPSLRVGSGVSVTDSEERTILGVVTRQTLQFERGFQASCSCETPDLDDAGMMRAITPEGGVNAAALVGTVDGGLLAVGSVTARSIAVGSIAAEKISAGAVSAEKISAGAVTAEKLDAGSVTADKISAGAVSADKIAANAVTADKISAGAVKAEKIAAGAVKADHIDAGSITAEKIQAGSITADRLKAYLITADCGLIANGAIGTAQIADGSITSAKVVSLNADVITAGTLSAERLILVGEDGVIYRINAASSGLSASELSQDQYKNYINGTVIVAKSLTAAQIAAQTITGNEIAANAIKAANIDVVELFASEATIAQINAMDISGNQYLKLAVKDAVDAVEVGGRNLYTGTRDFTGDAWRSLSYWTEDGTYQGCTVMKRSAAWLGLYQDCAAEVGEYTLSAWVKRSENSSIVAYFLPPASAEGSATAAQEYVTIPDAGTQWTRVSATFEVTTAGTIRPRFENTVEDEDFWVCGLKLEKGNVATDWTPAPEDAESEIGALETRVSAAEVKITPSAIVSTVTSSESYQTLSSTANTAQSTADTAKANAATAQSTADTAKANAATAQSTADTAKANAATAQSKADANESNIAALATRVSAAEVKITPSAIVSTVTSSESYQTLSSTANTAQSTADTAKANAATAQSTADTAKANAATAQSTADAAKTNAATAQSTANTNAEDIAALTTRVSEAELKITPSAIVATVKENVEVGGRNLLPNTREFTPMSSGDAALTGETYRDLAIRYLDCTALTSGYRDFAQWINVVYPEYGEFYTLSFYAKGSGKVTSYFYGDTGYVPVKVIAASEGASGYSSNYADGECKFALTEDWVRCWVTYQCTSSGDTSVGKRALLRLHYGNEAYVCGAKLEKGSVATDWTPAPEDAAEALSVDSDYSKVEINKDRVRIVSTQMEVAVPSEDGEDDVMRVDADGVHAEVVEADMIVSDSVVHTQGDASYTPADAGALAEILEDLSGKYLLGVLSIDCKNISSGSFEVQNVRGSGRIRLLNGTMNNLKISNCDCYIYCYSATFSTAGTGVVVDNSEHVFFSTCVLNAGVGVQLGSVWRARARMHGCTGTCTVLAKVTLCSELDLSGSKPTGTLDLEKGSQVYNATSDPTFTAPSSGETPEEESVTVSLSPTSTSTSGHSGLGTKLYQGRYTSSQSFRKGIMLFTLPTDLTSADSIDSATLTLKRISGVGGGGSVTAQIRCYNVEGTLYASKSFLNGQTASIDVTSAVKAMITNGYTGLMLYNPDTTTVGSKTYTTGYARFAGKGESGAPVLKVSYRK